ncbi:MAG: M48 family peptidase [Betaproteobacteria bacterium]|jgi:predicted metal-dependent hydrolase|nr:M48 family peptidase [Betaproteobacteria bacterium]NBP44668.1 M48 family peptidase [Betaproteobacteria bacterium]
MGKLFQLALDFFSPPAPQAEPESQRGKPPLTETQALLTDNAAIGFHHPKANRRIDLQGMEVLYHHQHARRKTIGMLVGQDGLEVRAPRWVGRTEIEAALRERASWIIRKLGEAQQARRDHLAQAIVWQDGALVPYLGQHLRLVLDPTLQHAAFDQALRSGLADESAQWHLHLGLSQQASAAQIRDATQAWLMQMARQLFTERLDHYAPKLQVRWTHLSLSSANTRWGTASADGRIRLNWRLIHFKPSVIDYVVVHELSHLRVMNHSPQFWDTVASVVPDYQGQRKALRTESIPPWL